VRSAAVDGLFDAVPDLLGTDDERRLLYDAVGDLLAGLVEAG
jgi:hypothetical protein